MSIQGAPLTALFLFQTEILDPVVSDHGISARHLVQAKHPPLTALTS